MTASDVLARLEAAGALAARSRTALIEGETVDLSELTGCIEAAGAAAEHLPRDQLQALQPAMLNLLADLDELNGMLVEAHAAARAAIDNTGTFRKAVGAYARKPGS